MAPNQASVAEGITVYDRPVTLVRASENREKKYHSGNNLDKIVSTARHHHQSLIQSGKSGSIVVVDGEMTIGSSTFQNSNNFIYVAPGGHLHVPTDTFAASSTLPAPSSRRIKCGVCRAPFASLKELELHEREKPHTCKKCRRCFIDQATLDNHKSSSHFYCWTCRIEYKTADEQQAHFDKEHPRCEFCPDLYFKSKIEYNKHKSNVHIWCTICSPAGYVKSVDHLWEQHKYCDMCKSYCTHEDYDAHLKSHPTCGLCKNRYLTAAELKTHRKKRHPRCVVCSDSPHRYKDWQALSDHYWSEHFVCDRCDGVFASKSKMEIHRRAAHHNR